MAKPTGRPTRWAATALLVVSALVPTGCASGRYGGAESEPGSEEIPIALQIVLLPFVLALAILDIGSDDDGCGSGSYYDSDSCDRYDDAPTIRQKVRHRR